jgi:hypothetical protein
MLQFWLICSSRSRAVQGDIAGPSGLLRREYRIRCGPRSGAWPVLASGSRGFAELVRFGGLPGPDVRLGRQRERGVPALRPSEYLAICLRLQDWDLGLAGGRRRAGVYAAGGDRSRRGDAALRASTPNGPTATAAATPGDALAVLAGVPGRDGQ